MAIGTDSSYARPMSVCPHADCGFDNSPQVTICGACHRPLHETSSKHRLSEVLVLLVGLYVVALLIVGLAVR